MQPLRLNPKTGYLESHAITENIFDSEKKIRFLQIANDFVKRREFPQPHLICEALGINPRTLENHLARDQKFNEEWKEIKFKLSSIFTAELAEKAKTKMGVIANLALLRYLENGTWNMEQKIIHATDNSGTQRLINQFPDAIDADIVENPTITGTHHERLENKSQ